MIRFSLTLPGLAESHSAVALIVCKPCFGTLLRMPNHASVHPFVTTFPAPQPWDAPDPVPVMRRELKLLLIEINMLRVEVEQLRATVSAQHRGILLCVRQPDYVEPRPVATRSGTPQRIDRASAAMVTILVAVS